MTQSLCLITQPAWGLLGSSCHSQAIKSFNHTDFSSQNRRASIQEIDELPFKKYTYWEKNLPCQTLFNSLFISFFFLKFVAVFHCIDNWKVNICSGFETLSKNSIVYAVLCKQISFFLPSIVKKIYETSAFSFWLWKGAVYN